MANRPQTEKLKKLNLFLHECGRLYSARNPDAHCSRCGPDVKVEPTVAAKPKRTRAAKPTSPVATDAAPAIDESAPPAMDETRRAKNEAAREKRAARRAGLGKPDATAVA